MLDHYNLDGVEFCDTDAAKSSVPGEFPYPEGDIFEDGVWKHVDLYPDSPGEREGAWENGGDTMNNAIFRLRQFLPGYDSQPIIVREENYGRYLPPKVSATDFTARDDQVNYFVNPHFNRFGSDPGAVGESVVRNLDHRQYGPLSVNFEGDPSTGTVMPPIEDPLAGDQDIAGFSTALAMGGFCDYGLIYYYNLKPVSRAAAENYLTLPSAPGTKLTQAEYISITSREVFGENVICSGGDYQKTW
jgi:hypothetical protein